MSKNRKETEAYIIKYIDKIAPNGFNKKLYVDLFASMNDKDFNNFMIRLRDKKLTLSVITPNTEKPILTTENNFKIAEELGYKFFQKLIIEGEQDEPSYKTPNEFLVLSLPVRRAAQLLTKKISIPSDDKSIDLTSGQVTGKSKGSKLTMPEIQVLSGMGLKYSMIELLRDRGGDLGAKNAMNALLAKQGSASQQLTGQYSTRVVSTKTLSSYLKASHIITTLDT